MDFEHFNNASCRFIGAGDGILWAYGCENGYTTKLADIYGKKPHISIIQSYGTYLTL